MAARKAISDHYHGHVGSHWTPSAEPAKDTFSQTLLGAPHEVAAWIAAQLREAKGNPDLELTDELSVWVQAIKDREIVTTGLSTGPTITAVPVAEGQCWCERPELRAISGKHSQ